MKCLVVIKYAAEAARPGDAKTSAAAAAGVDASRVESLLFVVAVWPRLDHDQGGPIAAFGTTPTPKLLGATHATTDP